MTETPSPVIIPSDGRCTGFPNGVGAWDWSNCCVIHDGGGSDGALVDCIAEATPGLPIVFILAAVALMALFRPVYNLCQRWGWAK